MQLLSVSAPSGKRPALVIGRTGRSGRPEATGRAGRRHVAATLLRSGGGLVTLGGPWIDEAAVVEAVDDQAGGVAQHHAAFSDGNVGRKGALVVSSGPPNHWLGAGVPW